VTKSFRILPPDLQRRMDEFERAPSRKAAKAMLPALLHDLITWTGEYLGDEEIARELWRKHFVEKLQ